MKVQAVVCDVCNQAETENYIEGWLELDGKDVCPDCADVIVEARRLRLIDAVLEAEKKVPLTLAALGANQTVTHSGWHDVKLEDK